MVGERHALSSDELRERLDAIMETYKDDMVGKQIRAIAELATEFGHGIRLVGEAVSEEPETFRFTCFEFALDLRGSRKVKAIASRQPHGSLLYPSPEFVQYLIADYLEEILPGQESAGDLVVYASGGSVRHAGVLVAPGVVISKWGLMHLWVHGTLEVPSRYGSEVRYFKRLSRRECVNAFVVFCAGFSPTSDSNRDDRRGDRRMRGELARRRALLTVALSFTRLRWRESAPPASVALARWLDSWHGLGAVVVGMTAQGFNLELKEFPRGWRANFYSVGIAHSVVLGSAYELTPWGAAWEVLSHEGRDSPSPGT